MATIIDVRTIDPRFQNALVFSTFEGLIVGSRFSVMFDHDPRELQQLFRNCNLPNFEWVPKLVGPELWEVEIRKTDSKGTS